MRRVLVIILVALMMPSFGVTANEDPFNFFVEDEVVIHPGETVPFRIAWQNIVGFERHFSVAVNHSDANVTIEDLPTDWTRVASGRLGELSINLTVAPNSNFETIKFSLLFTCQEISNWTYIHEVDVLVSRWSDIKFGVNDGSEFYVLQDVRTTFAVNVSNSAPYDDIVTLRFDTTTTWGYGFDEDANNDNELHIDLESGDFKFIDFWIQTPPITNGGPLAGTGPEFTLEAKSNLDRRISYWNFSLEMQTFHNMTIDRVAENLSIEPGDNKRLEVLVRNNGNVDTYLDSKLKFGNIEADRLEVDNWTIAIFNAFEFQPLQPNESRLIEIGFEAPNTNLGNIDVDLIIMPQSFPQRASSVSISSEIDWNRNASIKAIGNNCLSVEWNQTCQQVLSIENTGNYFEQFTLELENESGMDFTLDSTIFGLSKGEITDHISLNFSTLKNADALLPAYAKVNLLSVDGIIFDSIEFSSITSPRVNWVWEDSASSVNNGKLEVVITMRNDGNTADGLIVRMSTSYFTDMSFIPPDNAVIEEGSTNIRSFEVADIAKGANFTFRAWAKIPDNQNSGDEFYLNITAHSRLAEENPFDFSANTSFEAAVSQNEDGDGFVNSLSDFASTGLAVVWAWKWIIFATLLSGLMINKSLRDRKARLADAALMSQQTSNQEVPQDWMAEFANKKQATPEIAQSPQIPSEVFAGMFQAVSGGRKPSSEPVDSRLVGAASNVLDHHDNAATKSKLDGLLSDIETGDVSTPHSANVALPDDIVPVTERTVPIKRGENIPPPMLDLDDLDL